MMQIKLGNLVLGWGKNTPDGESQKRGFYFGSLPFIDPTRDEFGLKVSFESLFLIYRQQGDVFASIEERAKTAGMMGYNWFDPIDTQKEVSPVLKRQLDDILQFDQTFEQFKTHVFRDLGITANSFVTYITNQIGNTILGLQILDPRSIGIVVDQHGNVIKYMQRIQGRKPVLFEPDEIMHFKDGRDPNNGAFGLSKIEPIILEARTDIAASQSNYAFFKNDAKPSILYMLDDALSEAEQKEAIKKIKQDFGGATNRHKSAVLAGVKEVKTIGVSQKDMEFLQQRKFSTGKICSVFGVPAFILGLTEMVNNNNGVELTKNYIRKTIMPLEDMFEQVINRGLIKRLKLKLEFKFNDHILVNPEELEERAKKLYEKGMVTLRQAKKIMEQGYEFVPGMKVSWVVTNGKISPLEAEPWIDGAKFEHKPDYEYYARRMAMTFARITDVFGWDMNSLMTGSQQKTLFSEGFGGGDDPVKREIIEVKKTDKKLTLDDFL